MNSKKNKIALVAGGAGAVGEGVVRQFLAAGWSVFMPSRSAESLARLRENLGGGAADRLLTAREEIGTEEGAARVRDEILQRFGKLDAVVASLGGWWQGLPLVNVPLETWNEILRNNLTAHFVAAKSFLPVLLHQNEGSYTFIAGLGGVSPVAHSIPVSVAVAGQIMMVKGLQAENKNSGAQINALVLGVVNTRERGEQAQSDWITAEDVGDFALRLHNAETSGAIVRLADKPALTRELQKLSLSETAFKSEAPA